MSNIVLGTCSWNYSSWVGLVYKEKRLSPADYLKEYAKKFGTAEIDSWFYRIPSRQQVLSYARNAPDDFSFTCKITRDITMPFLRGETDIKNPKFLDPEFFKAFCDAISFLIDRIELIIFEFEYLNKAKMMSVFEFIDRFGDFKNKIGNELPVGIETRNSNYLTREYFEFLYSSRISHVFCEKQYMPHVFDVYSEYKDLISGKSVIRLLGEDRAEIERKSGKKWDRIVKEVPTKDKIVSMSLDMKNRVIINVNNHYEGSAPLTIDCLKKMFKDRGVTVS